MAAWFGPSPITIKYANLLWSVFAGLVFPYFFPGLWFLKSLKSLKSQNTQRSELIDFFINPLFKKTTQMKRNTHKRGSREPKPKSLNFLWGFGVDILT
jgi:hypothetical protein